MTTFISPGVYFDVFDYKGEASGCTVSAPEIFRDIQIGKEVIIPWILGTGFWNDSQLWLDTELWKDGPGDIPTVNVTSNTFTISGF